MMDADAFMDDLMNQFFGGGASGFNDFEEFIEILEGGNDKTFRKMFRELGRATRVQKQPRNARKAALNKGGSKRGAAAGNKAMEKEMMEMLGFMAGGPPQNKKKGKKSKNRQAFDSDDDDFGEEAMMEEMMMHMMMGGGMPNPGK